MHKFDHVTLSASDEGRPLYESLGFTTTSEMSLSKRDGLATTATSRVAFTDAVRCGNPQSLARPRGIPDVGSVPLGAKHPAPTDEAERYQHISAGFPGLGYWGG